MERVFIDVGAGSAEAYQHDQLGEFDRCILIEANVDLASRITKQFLSRKDIEVVPKALTVTSEEVALNVARPLLCTSLSVPRGIRKRFPGLKLLEQRAVETITVEELLSGLENCELNMRLDCCGGELEIIAASFQALPLSSVILGFDVRLGVDEPEFESSSDPKALVDLLGREGYRVEISRTRSFQSLVFNIGIDSVNELLRENRILRQRLSEVEQKLDEALAEVQEKNKFSEILNQMSQLEANLKKQYTQAAATTVKQIESFISIRDYLASGSQGLNFHGWPISSDVGLYLLHLIDSNDYDCIIEFGSGTSTVLFAEAMLNKSKRRVGQIGVEDVYPEGSKNEKDLAVGLPTAQDIPRQIVAFEHDKRYLGETTEMLEARSLRYLVNLVHSPLIETQIGESNWLYYDCAQQLKALSELLANPSRILVLVDGPPQQVGEKARYPALHMLLQHLAVHSFDILVDDYSRKAERQMVTEWEALLSQRSLEFSGERIEAEKGAYHLKIN